VNSVVELLSLRAPTVGDLPPPKTRRWVARRKAAVVTAVRSGTITMRKPYVATTPPKRNSSPGSVRLKPTAFRVCAPRAFSNTVARVRRVTPDRGADIVGLSVQRRQRLPSWHATDWPTWYCAWHSSPKFVKQVDHLQQLAHMHPEQPARRPRRPARDQLPV